MSSLEASSFYEGNSLIKRVALCMQYDGSSYSGWQRQKRELTVQYVLEKAISELDPYRPIKAVAAGRTDAGVHASGQVVHFDCSGHIPANRWASALNGRLPKTIRVRESVLCSNKWHACHSATYRRYRYTIYNGCKPNLFLTPWSWHRYRFRLDEKLMLQGLEELVGFYDFRAFQKAGSNRSHSWTSVQDVRLDRQGDLLFLEIQASGFLYGMVRLLVGQLVALGEHRLSLQTFLNRWKEKLREDIRDSAPAHGLCLVQVGYKEILFSKSAFLESFPKYSLLSNDPPKDPL
tara:strand:- start:4780 stop:5652 length:873 start_codon:yes stop_codon:yes gene_type:complete